MFLGDGNSVFYRSSDSHHGESDTDVPQLSGLVDGHRRQLTAGRLSRRHRLQYEPHKDVGVAKLSGADDRRC